MAEKQPQIEIRNLWKVFGNKPERALDPSLASESRSAIQEDLGLVVALRDVSFQVNRGEIFVVMGLSGSGKSTLVRCLIRLIEPTSGAVRYDGEDIFEFTSKELIQFRRQKVAMVFQHYGLLPHRRVLDNVAYGLEIRGMEKEARYSTAAAAIERVGLKGWEDYFPNEMSGGMQQRVGLARALAVDPEVLLMDEPFSGLDPLIRREMQDDLISLETELHKTIVFITHDFNEALKIGDHIAIMRDGEIVQQGSPEEIVTRPTDDYVAQFVKDVSKAKIIQAEAIMQEPSAVVREWQEPEAALQAMRSSNTDRAFLAGGNGILKGILTEDQVADLVHQHVTGLEKIPTEPVMTASPSDSLEEIVPMAARTEHPIAVLDAQGRLVGEIHRGALLAGMVESGADAASAGSDEENSPWKKK